MTTIAEAFEKVDQLAELGRDAQARADHLAAENRHLIAALKSLQERYDEIEGERDDIRGQLGTLRMDFAAAVGVYDCPCGSVFEFDEHSTLEDYAALNRWLGSHVTGGCR